MAALVCHVVNGVRYRGTKSCPVCGGAPSTKARIFVKGDIEPHVDPSSDTFVRSRRERRDAHKRLVESINAANQLRGRPTDMRAGRGPDSD